MKKIYNKLVRDNIINIIESAGKTCSYRIMDDKEYLDSLNKKLIEEMNEYQEEYSIEELADLQEVILAILNAKGISLEEFNKIRQAKADKNGYYNKKIMLIDVTKKDE